MRASTAGAVGRIRCSVWKDTGADGGAGSTLIVQDQIGATVTLSTTADVNSSITFNPGAVTLVNEWLFFQVQWEETTAGSSNNDNVFFRVNTSTAVTANWTANLLGTKLQADGAASVAAGGAVRKPSSAQMDGAASAAATGSAIKAASAQMDGAASVSATGSGIKSAAVSCCRFQSDGTSDVSFTGSTALAIIPAPGAVVYTGTVAPGSGGCPSGTVGGQTVAGCATASIGGAVRNVPFY
jgi:hypothetical protein